MVQYGDEGHRKDTPNFINSNQSLKESVQSMLKMGHFLVCYPPLPALFFMITPKKYFHKSHRATWAEHSMISLKLVQLKSGASDRALEFA